MTVPQCLKSEEHVLQPPTLKTGLKTHGGIAISTTELRETIGHLPYTAHLCRISTPHVLFYTLNTMKCLQSTKRHAHFSCLTSAFPFIFLPSTPLSLKISLLTHSTIIHFFPLNSVPQFLYIKNLLCLVYPY